MSASQPAPHLDDAAFEAVAHDRRDLVAPEALTHLAQCEQCRAELQQLRELSERSAEWLSTIGLEPDAAELDALVAHSLASAEWSATVVPRRALGRAAAVAGLMLVALIAVSAGMPGSGLLHTDASALRRAVSSWLGTSSLIEREVPGGWNGVGLAGVLVLAAMVAWTRRRLGDAWQLGSGADGRIVGWALAVGLLGATAPAAHALELDGDWPQDERITLSLVDRPLDEALRQAAKAAGLDVVVSFTDNPRVSLDVRDVALREVMEVLLEGKDITVSRRGRMLVVRQTAAALAVDDDRTAQPSTDDADAADGETPARDRTRRSGRDAIFGNIVVAADEAVERVDLVFGNIDVHGAVDDDVSTVFGNVHVGPSGQVGGDAETVFGNIAVEPGGKIGGRSDSAFGISETAAGAGPSAQGTAVARALRSHGHVDETRKERWSRWKQEWKEDFGEDWKKEWKEGWEQERKRTRSDEEEGFVHELVSDAIRTLFIYLLALLMMGAAPKRLANLQAGLVKAPGRRALTGLAGIIGAVVATIVLCITLIGIPVGILLALATVASVYVGFAAIACVLGALLPVTSLRGKPLRRLAAGSCALFVLLSVPGLDAVFAVAGTLLALGTVIDTRLGTRSPHGALPPASAEA